ncbi:MAG: hypothetical protein GY861_17010 [bacterium]|nr:hypothetical protein [bacterium]
MSDVIKTKMTKKEALAFAIGWIEACCKHKQMKFPKQLEPFRGEDVDAD